VQNAPKRFQQILSIVYLGVKYGLEITELPHRIHAGDKEAMNTLISLVYTELKKLASSHLHRESSAGRIETTAVSYSSCSNTTIICGRNIALITP
jgi:hypothetical protein